MLKVELHIHTKYSYDSSTSLKEVVDVCIKKGIDAVAITDHNEIEGALRLTQIALFKVIVGQEILTKEGEITGLFIKHSIPPGLSIEETLKRIKKQGGLVYLPHPFDKFTRKTAINKNQIVKHMSNIDIIEGFNGRSVDTLSNKKAVKLANKFNKLVGIGSDAHTKYEIGRNYLEMPDFSNAEEFLKSLSRAKFKTSRVMLWPFLFTKWVRFNKRHKIFQPKAKRITGKTNCDFCGGQELLVIYKKKGQIRSKYLITDDSYGVHPQIVKCLSCNLVFSYPRDKDSQILKRYINFKDPLYEKERKERAENQRKILDEINRLTGKKGKLLEIGCATGLF